MTDYSDLIERVGKAEGPDREIDQALWEAVTGECTHRNTHFVYLENDERELECSDCGADTYGKDKWSGLTASLDAALSLVDRMLPGWGWSAGRPLGDIGFWASVWREGFSIDESGHVWRAVEGAIGLQPDPNTKELPKKYLPTPALAVIAALLRALEEKGKV